MKKRILFLIVLLSLAGGFLVYRHSASETAPNVLLITIDTLRADHLGCYGYSRHITPNLDKLASRGVLFENAFCVMPTTIPSHASILFGTWPRIHGSISNFNKITNHSLSYLPAVLKQHEYTTAAFVSATHLGREFGHIPGFDVLDSPKMDRTADITLSHAQNWLNDNAQKKFFLWIHLWDPHSPYLLHPESMKKINPNFDDNFVKHYAFVKPGFYSPDRIQSMKDLYDNEIAYADAQLGEFLDRFENSGLAKNTMIVLASDHGETLDELADREGYAFDHGEFLYDHQLHVPLIIVLPGKVSAGVKIQHTACLIDILPTILDRLHIGIPTQAAGNSLLPYILNTPVSHPDEVIFLERRVFKNAPRPFLAQDQFGIRETTFKLLFNAGAQVSLLYKNNNEFQDVGSQQERIKSMMQARLDSWLLLTESFAKHEKQAVSEDEAEKLRSLGYVQ